MYSKAQIGFKYHFEAFSKDGELLWEDTALNLIPDQGRDYILNAAMLAGSQFSSWYIGLYSGNYTPQPGDTMATIVGAATEITTGYSEASRQLIVPDALDSGVYVNAGSKAEFTFVSAEPVIVRGGFISSSGVKGGTSGILLSAVLSSSPKSVEAGEILRITAGLSLVSA